MKLQKEIEMIEKRLDELSDQLHILKGRPEDQIKKLFHVEVVSEVSNIQAFVRNLEARIYMDRVVS